MTPLLSLAGKHAVITGATGAIGEAVARALAQEGVRCTLLGRREFKLRETIDELPVFSGGGGGSGSGKTGVERHAYRVVDVRDYATVKAVGGQLLKDPAGVDFLVNAAGVAQSKLLNRMSEGEIGEILDTNLFGTIVTCRHLLKPLVTKAAKAKSHMESPAIVNVSSVLAQSGGLGASVYAASKAGVLGFTRALSHELGPLNVRVNAILLGFVHSTMLQDYNVDKLASGIPLRRIGEPEEAAAGIIHLLQNKYANGATFNLDGGLLGTLKSEGRV